MASDQTLYYVPDETRLPLLGSAGLFALFAGIAVWANGGSGLPLVLAGSAIVIAMMFLWFRHVIAENQRGAYNTQVDRSFRMGMMWFILSEVMFFACFFSALFYARGLALPWLGGEGTGVSTHALLWPGFEKAWPSNGPGAVGGDYQTMGAWVPLRQQEALRHPHLTGWATHARLDLGELLAGLVQAGPRRAVNRPVDAAAPGQRSVRRVDDRVDVEPDDGGLDHLHRRRAPDQQRRLTAPRSRPPPSRSP